MPPPLTDELQIANALRNQALPRLEHLAHNPSLLDRDVTRFDRDEPPPYTSSTEVDEERELSWLSRGPIESLSDEAMRIIDPPLDDKERVGAAANLAYSKGIHRPGPRYEKEVELEKGRIESWARCKANEDASNYLYQLGPAKKMRAGQERVNILARRNIKRRWKKLGVWNQHWGIPAWATTPRPDDEWRDWLWRWEQEGYEWEIGPDVLSTNRQHPVVRCLNLRRDLSRTDHCPVPPRSHLEDDAPKSQAEAFLISRPWFVHEVAMTENFERSRRLNEIYRPPWPKPPVPDVTEVWKQLGEWKESWGAWRGDDLAGWKWRHESPSPEPEDLSAFNDMATLELTPSEADALDAVRPPSPPTPRPPTPEPRLRGGTGLFGPGPLYGRSPSPPPLHPPPYPVEELEPGAEVGSPEPAAAEPHQPPPRRRRRRATVEPNQPPRRSARIAAMAARRAAQEAADSRPATTRKRRANDDTERSRPGPAANARAPKRTRTRRRV